MLYRAKVAVCTELSRNLITVPWGQNVECWNIQPWLCKDFFTYKRLIYRGADKFLVRTTSRCILFDGENISFDASLVIYINSTNIPLIVIINRIYEHQNLLSL